MAEEHQNANTIDNLDDLSQSTSSATEEAGLVIELQQALVAKAEEVKSLNDKYLRLAAEFDNYKRLSQRDQRDQIRFGNEHLLKELLPVVDNLERAIKASQEGGNSNVLIQGVDLTLKQLTGALIEVSCHTRRDGRPAVQSRHTSIRHLRRVQEDPGTTRGGGVSARISLA